MGALPIVTCRGLVVLLVKHNLHMPVSSVIATGKKYKTAKNFPEMYVQEKHFFWHALLPSGDWYFRFARSTRRRFRSC